MRFSTVLPVVFALTSLGLAAPTPGGAVSNLIPNDGAHRLAGPPLGWVKDDNAVLDKDTSMMDLRIKIGQRWKDEFLAWAKQFEEPGPAGLKKEMPEKLRKEIDMCKLDSRKVILGWLTENGFSDCVSESPESGAFIVHASIARIEKLLGATYETFENESTGERVVRTLHYDLPTPLKFHLSGVQPTTSFVDTTASASSQSPISVDMPTAAEN